MDIRKLQRLVVDALEDVKGADIKVYNSTGLTQLFDRVIIASGTSNRQTRALAASVRDKVKAAGGAHRQRRRRGHRRVGAGRPRRRDRPRDAAGDPSVLQPRRDLGREAGRDEGSRRRRSRSASSRRRGDDRSAKTVARRRPRRRRRHEVAPHARPAPPVSTRRDGLAERRVACNSSSSPSVADAGAGSTRRSTTTRRGCRPNCRIVLREVRPEPRTAGKTVDAMTRAEADRIRAALPKRGPRIALDERGRDLTSSALADVSRRMASRRRRRRVRDRRPRRARRDAQGRGARRRCACRA